jgi:hypothetical protein
MPADLDQFGGDNSHGAIVGRKGLVELSHHASDGRAFLYQVYQESGIGQIQGRLDPGNAGSDYHY